ncbi:TPA: hypothetical protein N2D80_003178 [Clostridium botulinum]|nr:hypothetical protein [Clostridium botulinum]HDI4925024.1 hypothetical protein [Clostridium botulinum]
MEQTSKIIDFPGDNRQHRRINKSVIDFGLSKEEAAFTREEVTHTMDDNKILEKYLDKVDQDRRDVEIRIIQDRRESEKRIEEQRKLSEERIENRFNKVMDSLEKTNNKIDSQIEFIRTKLDTSVEKIDTKVDEKLTQIDTKYESLKWWILGTCLATILAIGAMLYSK